MYFKLFLGVAQRPIGCSGIDDDFGTVSDPKWPLRNMNSPIWASRAMDCGLNDYAPEGKPVHEIVEELATDNEHFAKVFLGKSILNTKTHDLKRTYKLSKVQNTATQEHHVPSGLHLQFFAIKCTKNIKVIVPVYEVNLVRIFEMV